MARILAFAGILHRLCLLAELYADDFASHALRDLPESRFISAAGAHQKSDLFRSLREALGCDQSACGLDDRRIQGSSLSCERSSHDDLTVSIGESVIFRSADLLEHRRYRRPERYIQEYPDQLIFLIPPDLACHCHILVDQRFFQLDRLPDPVCRLGIYDDGSGCQRKLIRWKKDAHRVSHDRPFLAGRIYILQRCDPDAGIRTFFPEECDLLLVNPLDGDDPVFRMYDVHRDDHSCDNL